jgi:hypothetical protein
VELAAMIRMRVAGSLPMFLAGSTCSARVYRCLLGACPRAHITEPVAFALPEACDVPSIRIS